ncbi:MAG: DUF1398 family protein [Xanthobacteraceae bacterium]
MDSGVKEVMVEATRASDEERATFGDVVMKLTQAGVERHHCDLVRGEKTYYLPNGESEVVAGEAVGVAPAGEFSAAGVDAAVREIQAGKIQYRTFCTRIAEAGCVGYHVSLAGQRAVYYGRTGDCHVEWFPGAKREKAA